MNIVRIPIATCRAQGRGAASADRTLAALALTATLLAACGSEKTSKPVDLTKAVRLDAAQITVREMTQRAGVVAHRDGNQAEADTAAVIRVTPGSARFDTDFRLTSLRLEFPAGSSVDTLIIPLIADSIPEVDETFSVALSSDDPDLPVNEPKSATITITDQAADFQLIDTNGQSPSFSSELSPRDELHKVSAWYFGGSDLSTTRQQFDYLEQLQQALDQQRGPFDLPVRIFGCNAIGQEGQSGDITSGRTLPWLQDTPEQSVIARKWGPKPHDVVLLDEANNYVGSYNLASHDLGQPGNFARLFDRLVELSHRSAAAGISLSESTLVVFEMAHSARGQILREGDRSSAGMATLLLHAGSAEASKDFVGGSRNISFAVSQAQATFDIYVFPDSIAEPDETFTAELTSSQVDLPVLAPGRVEVTITDLATDFQLPDTNPNSESHGALLSPRDERGRISAWYFGHSG